MKYWILGMLLITQVAFSRNLAITAHRLEEPLEVDGKLIEKFYLSVAGIDSFIQQQPIENALPTEKTIVWISYDAKSLYVSAQLYDSHPDSIIALLGRRDSDMNSDLFFSPSILTMTAAVAITSGYQRPGQSTTAFFIMTTGRTTPGMASGKVR